MTDEPVQNQDQDQDQATIAPTGAFRPGELGIPDRDLGDEESGMAEQPRSVERGTYPNLLPPPPERRAPTTSLAERVRARIESEES
jgi:hypothetical protein